MDGGEGGGGITGLNSGISVNLLAKLGVGVYTTALFGYL